MLVPRVQRFFIDEDCLLMLCSDGLSDFDRVEQIYPDYLLPILKENKPLDRSCQDLIDKANELNGHDNTTLALMRCRFAPPDQQEDDLSEGIVVNPDLPLEDTEDIHAPDSADAQQDLALEPAGALANIVTDEHGAESADADIAGDAKTELAVAKQTNTAFIVVLILIALLLGSGLAAWQVPQVRDWVQQQLPKSSR